MARVYTIERKKERKKEGRVAGASSFKVWRSLGLHPGSYGLHYDDCEGQSWRSTRVQG